MSRLIDKLLFMIDRCQSEPAGYSLFSSQMASTILFYCTWNVKSAQPLVDCGALERMLNITQKLLIDKDSDAPLRWDMFPNLLQNVYLCYRLGWESTTELIWDHWLVDSFASRH